MDEIASELEEAVGRELMDEERLQFVVEKVTFSFTVITAPKMDTQFAAGHRF